MNIPKNINSFFIVKRFKLKTASLALFLFVIIYCWSSLIDSFRFNPDFFANKTLQFGALLILIFIIQLYEYIRDLRGYKQLHESEQRFSFILDVTKDVLYFLDLPERKYSYASSDIKELTGYSKEELSDIGFTKIMKKVETRDNDNASYSDFPKLLKANASEIFSAEYLIRTKEGSFKWVEDISLMRKDKSGKIIGTVGILRDITERKNYLSLINEERNNIEKYLEIAEVIFLILDSNYTVKLINKKGCRALGYDKSEILGKNWFDNFVPIKNREKRKRRLTDVFSDISPAKEYIENNIVDRFGEEHVIGWRTAIIRDNRNNVEALLSSGTDVTEQKRIEESLVFERHLLQTLMDTIPDFIYFKDTSCKYIRIGKGAHFNGLSDINETVGKTDFDFFQTDFARNSYIEEQEIIKTGVSVINKAVKEVFKDGSYLWVSTTKIPVYDNDGNITGIAGISRDITEIKKVEAALRDNENRWRNLLENSPMGIAIITDMKILYVNNEGIKLLGASSSDPIVYKNVFAFVPRNFRKDFCNLVRALNYESKKLLPHAECKLKKINDEIIEVEGAAIPVNYSGEESVQIVFRNISERKRQEKTQQIINDILQTANSEQNILYLYKFIHKSVGLVMKADNFYIALYDYESQTINFPYYVDKFDEGPRGVRFGNGLTEYVIKSGTSALLDREKLDELIAEGKFNSIGTPSKIWLGVPLKIQDKTIGIICVQDYDNETTYDENEKKILETIAFAVSRAIERKTLEEEREELINQLKESNLSKDRLFSLISHDLRSPFNALLGSSGILLNDYSKMSPAELHRHLTAINQTTGTLYNLVNNLLQFSRFQAGSVKVKPSKINIRELAARNILLLQGNAVKKDISIILNIDSHYAFADEDMINSVVQNLISNAIKFTNPGGEIIVSGKLLQNVDVNMIEISVKDNGVGMNENVIKKLFNPNSIYTSKGTRKESGSGLGLLLTKEFVEKNGGTILIKSDENIGTEFIFTVPGSK
jgi:PAS domain S-box-containing protein